jgi:hypothetical protein
MIRNYFLVLAFYFLGYTSSIFARSESNMLNIDTTFKIKSDSSFPNRMPIIIAANTVIYGGSMAALYQTWYKNYPQAGFRTFDDWDEWLQMDKFGHAYSAYEMSRYGYMLWSSTHLSEKKKIWLGGLTGVGYQTIIEILDGTRAQWGWSWGDVGGNILGSASFVTQQLAWKEQRIRIKTSFHLNRYDQDELNTRTQQLFGKSLAERFLKDYNSQTYWISTNVHSFFPKTNWPSWLNIAIGTGAEGLFGARSNMARDASGAVTFNRTDLTRYRQWYLAPDLDLTKIPTKNKWVRALFFVLNGLKFPTPALELSSGNMKFHWLYF